MQNSVFGTSTVVSNSGESSLSSPVLSTNSGIDNNTVLPKLTVILGVKSLLPHSMVSSNSGGYSPCALNPLYNSEILDNAFFSKKLVNSSEKCVLPQFTVNSNFGETCHNLNSQNPVFGTL